MTENKTIGWHHQLDGFEFEQVPGDGEGQGIMKIMVTSFTRSHARTATLSAPDPAAGHRQPTPPLETPGHSQASLGHSLVGSVLLSSGSQGFVCAL